MIALALILAAAGAVRAGEAGFAEALAAVERSAAPGAVELADRLRAGTREDRLEAATRASASFGGFDSADQRTLLWALREQAESSTVPGELRARCVLALGEIVPWAKDDGVKRDAVEALLGVLEASPHDTRADYRRHALKGLWAAARRLPLDAALEERAARAFLSGSAASDAGERVLALYGLDDLLRERPRVVSGGARVARELESLLLEPAASNPSAFSTDGRRDADERWATLRALYAYAWASGDARVRVRLRDLCSVVGAVDPNPVIRRQAEALARSIRG